MNCLRSPEIPMPASDRLGSRGRFLAPNRKLGALCRIHCPVVRRPLTRRRRAAGGLQRTVAIDLHTVAVARSPEASDCEPPELTAAQSCRWNTGVRADSPRQSCHFQIFPGSQKHHPGDQCPDQSQHEVEDSSRAPKRRHLDSQISPSLLCRRADLREQNPSPTLECSESSSSRD